MKQVKRIIIFIAIILSYFVLKEFVDLLKFLNSLHFSLSYIASVTILYFLMYYGLIPLYQIIKIPKFYGPTYDPKMEEYLIKHRIELFKKNSYLQKREINFNNIDLNKEGYLTIIKEFDEKCDEIRKKYVSKLFLSTSISQNGFIDAILVFSSSINLIRDIFELYIGRTSNRDLFTIAKNVYYSIAIAGSDVTEYASEEVFSKLASDSLKSIPFLDKIVSSIVDGYVNAALLTRISLITENFCKLTYVNNKEELYPSTKVLINTTKSLTSEIIEQLKKNITQENLTKTGDFAIKVMNPIPYLLGKSVNKIVENNKSMEQETKDKIVNRINAVLNPIDTYKSFNKKNVKQSRAT